MAIVPTQTYQVTGNREHLTNILVDVTPKNAYLLKRCRRARAEARRVDFQSDALAAAAANSVVEGAAISIAVAPGTTLLSAYTHLMEQTYSVSNSQDNVNWAGPTGGKYVRYLQRRSMMELSRDTEFELIQSTSATGTSAAARTMSGFQEIISTNLSTATAARDWSRALHNALMETTYNNGGDPDLMYCKPSVLTDLADFPADSGGGSGSVVRTMPASSSILHDNFDIYRDTFGERRIVGNQFAIPTATASGGIFFIRTDLCSLYFLQYTQTEELGKKRHSMDYVMWHELTLAWGNELAHASARQIS